jgi:hypothetical protein
MQRSIQFGKLFWGSGLKTVLAPPAIYLIASAFMGRAITIEIAFFGLNVFD